MWLCVLAAIAASIPAWIVRFPPIEDLPYHLAAMRVIHSFGDPAFGLRDHYVLTLGRTQYLGYYALGSLLSYVLGVVAANVVLMAAYFAGTVLGMAVLLRTLGKDPRLSLLSVPLTMNVMVLLGLFPFLLGIPWMLFSLALAVRYFDDPDWKKGIGLAVLGVALFYLHVVPFGLFAIGFLALVPWRRLRDWPALLAPALPGFAVASWWFVFTEAGKLTRQVGSERSAINLATSLSSVYRWMTDVFPDDTDERTFVALLAVALLTAAMGQSSRERVRPGAWRLVALPLVCAWFWFTTPEGRDYIWPLAPRFPILFALTVIPLLPMPDGWKGHWATMAAMGVAAYSLFNTSAHFIRFQQQEVGDFEQALEVIPPRQKVATLIYDRGSSSVNFSPFLHFGSYYQVRKGGLVQFSFAGYPHWPFDYAPGKAPPPGGPARRRWEWTPESVPVRGELYPYYDYVLVRGQGFHPPPGTFRQAFAGSRWSVWQREP
jgi:hypothetical protein